MNLFFPIKHMRKKFIGYYKHILERKLWPLRTRFMLIVKNGYMLIALCAFHEMTRATIKMNNVFRCSFGGYRLLATFVHVFFFKVADAQTPVLCGN